MKWTALLVCAAVLVQNPALDADLPAARNGNMAAVQPLLEWGASLGAKCRCGQTPLFFPARDGHDKLARFLLAKGGA